MSINPAADAPEEIPWFERFPDPPQPEEFFEMQARAKSAEAWAEAELAARRAAIAAKDEPANTEAQTAAELTARQAAEARANHAELRLKAEQAARRNAEFLYGNIERLSNKDREALRNARDRIRELEGELERRQQS